MVVARRRAKLDVRTLRFLIIFLKIGMGAQKPHPELGYGGSGCKIEYNLFDVHAISLDEMIIVAKTLVFRQELDSFRPQARRAPIVIVIMEGLERYVRPKAPKAPFIIWYFVINFILQFI